MTLIELLFLFHEGNHHMGMGESLMKSQLDYHLTTVTCKPSVYNPLFGSKIGKAQATILNK